MCGIGGIVRLDGGQVEAWRLEAMNKAMQHRGPDGEGYWSEGPVGLAHLRLAIIDLTTGDQPMFNEDGSIVVIFNGEIYNFLELRPLLQRAGHVFRTNSDTEVLLHAYEEWGQNMVTRLNGMFAFAIYDQRRQKLFLARDRLGVKPLYYYLGPDAFVFASEMSGMLASGLVPRDIDPTALDLYLHYQYVPAPYSIYRQTKKLAPAEWAELELPTKNFQTACYWDIATHKHPEPSRTQAEWLEELKALLDDAVRIRLISDVPFGAFLSGGTDSGLTVALMAEKLSEPVRTFSIGLAGEAKDETPYARMVAQRYQTQHEEFLVSPEGLTLIPKLCYHFGEPFADSSAVPTYYVSQIARSRVKMVLTGDGGDEMFAGYPRYSVLALAQTANPEITAQSLFNHWLNSISPPPVTAEASPVWRKLIRQTRHRVGYIAGVTRNTLALAKKRNSNGATHPWYDTYDISMSHFSLAERQALLGNSSSFSEANYFAKYFPFPAADSIVALAQYSDLKSYLPGDILVKVDRMSMANSLEVRSPLLDYRVAELAFSMPTSFKLSKLHVDGSTGKFILKELASQYLGREYVYRPKEGFGIPVSRWLREDKSNYLRDTLLHSDSPVYGYLNQEFIQNMALSHLNNVGDYSTKLWNLLMLDGWLRYIHSATGEKIL